MTVRIMGFESRSPRPWEGPASTLWSTLRALLVGSSDHDRPPVLRPPSLPHGDEPLSREDVVQASIWLYLMTPHIEIEERMGRPHFTARLRFDMNHLYPGNGADRSLFEMSCAAVIGQTFESHTTGGRGPRSLEFTTEFWARADSRENALVVLASSLYLSEEALAWVSNFRIPTGEIQIVRQQIVDLARAQHPHVRFPTGFCETRISDPVKSYW